MIVVTVFCSQGGSAHLGVGVFAVTSLCTTTRSIMQEPVAHQRMSKGTCLTLFTILTVTSHIKLTGRFYFGKVCILAWGVIVDEADGVGDGREMVGVGEDVSEVGVGIEVA